MRSFLWILSFAIVPSLVVPLAAVHLSGDELGQEEGRIVDKPIGSFRVEDMSLIDALLRLGQEHDLPLGIEYIDVEALQKPINVRLKEATIAQALDALLRQAKGYMWIVSGEVVVISHRSVPPGEKNLLNLVLSEFAIPQCTLGEASVLLRMTLDRTLHPGTVGWAGNYSPGGSRDRIGPLKLRNIAVREALNGLVSEHKNGAWVIHVPAQNLDQIPSQGLWTIFEYQTPPRQYSHILLQTLHAYKQAAPSGKEEQKK